MPPTLFSPSVDDCVSPTCHQGAPPVVSGNASNGGSEWFARCLAEEEEASVSEQVAQLERRLARIGGPTDISRAHNADQLINSLSSAFPNSCLSGGCTTTRNDDEVKFEEHSRIPSTAIHTALVPENVPNTLTTMPNSTQAPPNFIETTPISIETTPTNVYTTPSMAVNVNVESICRPGLIPPTSFSAGSVLRSSTSPKSTQTAVVRKSDVGTLTPPGERSCKQLKRSFSAADQLTLTPSGGDFFNYCHAAPLFTDTGKDLATDCSLAVDSCSSVYQQIMQSLGMPTGDCGAGDVAMATDTFVSTRQSGGGKKETVRTSASTRRAARTSVSTAAAATTPSKPAATKTSTLKATANEHKSRDRPTTNQKAASNDVTQRYLTFIDELIHEKKELATRCEHLASQTSSVELNYQQQINTLKEKHKQQIQALKRSLTETEKGKRQKWMESEREKIKESTARGMQSQIEQMVKQHTDEISRLREMYECRLAVSNNPTAVGGNVHPASFSTVAAGNDNQLRARLLLEKDEALQQAQLRHERQLSELSRDQESAVSVMNQQIAQLQSQLKSAQQATIVERQQSETELERKLTELRDQLLAQAKSDCLQLQTDLQEKEKALRENMRSELEDALSQQRVQLQQTADERLGSELQRVREERDSRVEEVVVRLEQEMRRTEENEAQRYTEKLRALEEKHAVDLRALETSEERYKCRYLDCRGRLAERDEELLEMKSRLTRKDSEIGEMKQTAEMLQHEQQQLGDVIEAEFRSQLSELRQSSARWQQRLREAELQHAAELNDAKRRLDCVQQKRQSELEALHKQIKQAFSMKEQSIAQLQCSLQHSQRKILQLERLIDKMQLGSCSCSTRTEAIPGS